MKLVWRIAFLILIIFAISLPSAWAQDDNAEQSAPITIDGSPVMQALVQALTDGYKAASGDEAVFEIAANGPNVAFEALCSDELDVVAATRYITDEEIAQCDSAGVEFVETLVGFQGLVAVLTPNLGANPVTCASLDQLDALYGLPAEGVAGDITLLDPLAESIPLTIYSPNADSEAYALLQALLPSGEIRGDVTFYDDPAEVVGQLSGGENGIAYMTLSAYDALENKAEVTALNIAKARTGDCYSASLSNIEVGSYEAARPLMLVTQKDSLEANPSLRDLLVFLNEEDGAALVSESGFLAPSAASVARNMNNITGPRAGRTFSRPASPVAISTTAEGTVNIGGSPLAFEVVNAMTSSFTTTYASATLNTNLVSNAAAWDDLCAKTVDVIFTTEDASDEQKAACEAAEVGTFDVQVGTEAVVFAVAAKNEDLPTCLTVENLAKAFAAPIPEGDEIPQSEGREIPVGVTNWNELDSSYPDLPLFIFLPGRSAWETDWVFGKAGMSNAFNRSDKEDAVAYDPNNREPGLYRAAAVANYDGAGLAVLRWGDFVRSEHVSDLRLLEVDGGSGCVAPNLATIEDGSYPFSTSISLHFSRPSMGNEVVAAFMWDALGETAVSNLLTINLPTVNDAGLQTARDEVFDLIEEAIAQAAAEAVTAIPELEATEESTPEPTEESADSSSN
jgi:phosphate transport system substrate-binding protein